MKDLWGRNAVVTGASRGLGLHVARRLAREGVNLALAARTVSDLERVREQVSAAGVKAVAIPTDASERSQLETLVERAESELGPTDILVNNAGMEMPTAFAEYPLEAIEDIVSVNLVSAMLLTRLVLPGMLDRGLGHIVNMASLAGKGGLPYETPYATTKAGLVMFTQSLRAELIDTPVGVSVVCPGFVADDGMYARIENEGFRAPMSLRPTTPKKVTEAVVKAIRNDAAELIVNPAPMRPLLVLREIAPSVAARIHKLLGVTDFSRDVAVKRDRKPV